MPGLNFVRITALVSLSCLGLAAQIAGPTLGFVADGTTAVRPVWGVAGAAILGAPRVIAAADSLHLSPARDYAVALLPPDRRAILVRSLSGSPETVALEVPPGSGPVTISPSGTAAALYYPLTQSVTVLTGLPESPAVLWNREIPFTGAVAAMAVSDDAAILLVAGSGDGAIWRVSSTGGAEILTQASSPSIRFLYRSADAVIADAGTGTVILARSADESVQLVPVGGPAEGVSRAVALAVSSDNRSALVANSEPAGVVKLSLDGGAPVSIPCDCHVATLESTGAEGVFRISPPGEMPLRLLDAAGSRIVFVPGESTVGGEQ